MDRAPAGHGYALITPVRRARRGSRCQHRSRAMSGNSFHHSAVRIQRRGSKIERLAFLKVPGSRRPGSKSRHHHAGCPRGRGDWTTSPPANSKFKEIHSSDAHGCLPTERGREINQVHSGTDNKFAAHAAHGNLICALFTSMEKQSRSPSFKDSQNQ